MITEASKSVLGMFLNGRYKIIHALSTGNLGQTYVAEDSWRNGTPQCVIKCFTPQNPYSSAQWETCQRRFTSDADALRIIGAHDQIPHFLDSFEDEQGFYLVRELIVGEPLSTELPIGQYDNQRLKNEQECVALLDDVLSILEVVHRQGIIHGDIKPSHLIRRSSDGKLVLIDFGVAHSTHTTPVKPPLVPLGQAIAPVAISPVGYVPAEQVAGQLYPCSDLYALGMIAIRALTGLDPLQLPIHPITGQIEWQLQVEVSDTLACVLNGMVRYDYRSRYQSATDARTALKSLMISKEQGLSTEESSESLESNSPSSLPNGDDLTLCLHDVNRLPRSYFSQSADVKEKQGFQEDKEEGKGSNTSQKWDYARELAIACIPKLPPVLTGMGAGIATCNALAISFGAYSLLYTAPSNPGLDLLERATQQYQAGKFEDAIALAKSVPTNSSVYQESVTTVQQWRSEWKQATAQFKAVEQAFQEGRWRDVLEESRNAPNIAFWRNKIDAVVEQAKPQLEAEAQQLLKQAYQLAARKDFTGAISVIKQIPSETPTGAKIQPKLQEYTQKQQIKAERLLQQAYQQASQRDFKGALKYLSQIPEDTATYEIARAKMTEYSRKQDFSEEVERQVKLAAKFPKEEIKLSNLPKPSKVSKKSSKVSSNLNPGNQFNEAAPKPALAKPARR